MKAKIVQADGNHPLSRDVRIFFEDQEVIAVEAATSSSYSLHHGYVELLFQDINGQPLYRDGKPLTQRVHGKVEILPSDVANTYTPIPSLQAIVMREIQKDSFWKLLKLWIYARKEIKALDRKRKELTDGN